MSEIPYTYSLGPETIGFRRLAQVARYNGNFEWRKIARLINKYNRLHDTLSNTVIARLEAKLYICRAMRDTKLPVVTKTCILEALGMMEDYRNLVLDKRNKIAKVLYL